MAQVPRRHDRMLRAHYRLHRPHNARRFGLHGIVYDATVRKIELLGEAARHIPEDVRARAPEIAWRDIIGTRNILVHGYFGIDDDILWDIARNKTAPLKAALQELDRWQS